MRFRTYVVILGFWLLAFAWVIFSLQFGKISALGNLAGFWWAAVYLVIGLAWMIHAIVSKSWRGVAIWAVGMAGFALAGAVTGFGVVMACDRLGVGHWPPGDAAFERRLRERQADFDSLRDSLLRQALEKEAEIAAGNRIEGARGDQGYFLDAGAGGKSLDVRLAYAAPDRHFLWLALWEGQIHFNPVLEKGLLFYDGPSELDIVALRSRRNVCDYRVAHIDGGWYLYEGS
jgi:hypothetical protein